jgi:hypothetical protein
MLSKIKEEEMGRTPPIIYLITKTNFIIMIPKNEKEKNQGNLII